MKVNELVQKGQYNSAFRHFGISAFQTALCAADLQLLMNLCELVNPSLVFEQSINPITKKPQPCQLQQPVILSLIQQLSQDLNSHTELKVRYLEEAIVNLDLANALTREHTPAVVNQLVGKLQVYIQNHPNEKKSMRIVLMAAQYLTNHPNLKQPLKQQQSANNTGKLASLTPNDNY